ncbi:transcriptional regulator [Nocardia farcinica]|nr:transcriptional regulator [Nocardia farcinica]
MAVDIDEPALLRALGEAITGRREELGLSQRALGLETGVERNMLRGVEDGSRRATIITLARIAEALKVPVSQLLHQIGH